MARTTTSRRLSRALLIGLGGTIALGTVFWLGNLSARTKQADERARAEKHAASTQPVDALVAKVTQDAAVLQTPTAPVAPVGQSTPTTRPAASGAPLLTGVSEVKLTGATPTTRPAGAQVASGALAAPGVPMPLVAGTVLADAKAKQASGKLLDARRLLNAALVSGQLSEPDQKRAKGMLNEINAVVVFSSKRFPDDEHGGTFTVPPGGALAKIANRYEVTDKLLMRLNGITDARKLQAGKDIKVLTGPFHALVDKSDFTLELWLGDPNAKGSLYITSFPVGLGTDDSTPTGVWAIQNKLQNPTYYSPRGEGVIDSGDPRNPLGEYWIGLTGVDGHAVGKQSYGIHGTIEPESIGKQASMGCIRLVNENVARVYEMLVEGKSTVTVRE